MKYSELILDPKNQHFIEKHIQEDINKLALKSHGRLDSPVAFLLDQIKARQKAKEKLPTFFTNNITVFPKGVPIEQCSSEETALYKAGVLEGESIIDITGGLGIDCWAFSKKFKRVVHLEQQELVQDCSEHNFKVLECSNVESVCTNSIEYLKGSNEVFDVLYLDPARRDTQKKKVFLFEECTPDVLDLMPLLQQKAKSIFLKASPLIDIKYGITALETVTDVYVVSWKNECREVLFKLGKAKNDNPIIHCVQLGDFSDFDFDFKFEELIQLKLSLPLKFIYEPNTSIMKAGAFKSIGEKYGLRKLNPNSHFYTSDSEIRFPGKCLKLKEELPYSFKALKKALPDLKASLVCRNFVAKTEVVKKKLKLKESNRVILIATKNLDDKPILLLTERV